METAMLTELVTTSSALRKWYLATLRRHEVQFVIRRPMCGAFGYVLCEVTWILAPTDGQPRS